MKRVFKYFSRAELILWSVSVIIIVLSFCIFDRESYLTFIASLIGVTSLIFNAKGNPHRSSPYDSVQPASRHSGIFMTVRLNPPSQA